MLALEVNLLTGRYVATAYNDRGAGEWPPHPARVYSALVAAHYSHPAPPSDERAALEWLERLPPPQIAASPASPREVVTVFVPVNDITVLGKASADDDAWHAASAECHRAESALEQATSADGRTAKRLQSDAKKARRALDKVEAALRKALAPAKHGKKDLESAKMLLPEHRLRQPRTQPSVTPELPRVVYAWPDAEPDPETRKALDHLSARVVRLGHSSSFVAMRVADGAPACNWQPAEDGPFRLRVTRAGQLTALEDRFDLHRETLPRVMPADFQPYVDGEEEVEPPFPAPFLGGDWLILRRTGGPDLVSPSTVGLACSIRRALLKHASQPVSEMISGHRRDGSPSDVPHLAIVPLPFVGHRQADGRILGVALAVPRDASIADRTALFQAVANWEAAVRRDDEDAPELPVFLGRSGVLQLRRQEDDPGLTTLRSRSWCRPARRWLSATPVALDRHPGDLRSRNIAKLSRAVQEAQETIAKACERIGLPAPRRITVLPAAPLAGAYKTRAFPHYPPGRDRERRALTHVTLEFAEPVRGPLLIGAGRYLGLGLLTPEVDRDD